MRLLLFVPFSIGFKEFLSIRNIGLPHYGRINELRLYYFFSHIIHTKDKAAILRVGYLLNWPAEIALPKEGANSPKKVTSSSQQAAHGSVTPDETLDAFLI